jgi:hypothetical protein
MFQEILRLIGTAAEDATCASIRPTMFTRPKASDGSPAPGWQGKSLKSGPWGQIWDPTEGRRRGIKAERYRATVRLSCAGAAVQPYASRCRQGFCTANVVSDRHRRVVVSLHDETIKR